MPDAHRPQYGITCSVTLGFLAASMRRSSCAVMTCRAADYPMQYRLVQDDSDRAADRLAREPSAASALPRLGSSIPSGSASEHVPHAVPGCSPPSGADPGRSPDWYYLDRRRRLPRGRRRWRVGQIVSSATSLAACLRGQPHQPLPLGCIGDPVEVAQVPDVPWRSRRADRSPSGSPWTASTAAARRPAPLSVRVPVASARSRAPSSRRRASPWGCALPALEVASFRIHGMPCLGPVPAEIRPSRTMP